MSREERQVARELTARQEAVEMADNAGIDSNAALAVFDILGPDELGDGFATALEDMADYGCFNSGGVV